MATFVTPSTPAPMHPGLCAAHVNAPLLMMIAQEDEMPNANSPIARMVFDAAPQPKQLIEMDGGHFGLLHYLSPLFDQTSRAQIDFLTRYLV